MTPTLPGESTLVRYLLGRLDEKEREELEGRLLREESLDEELLATTDDLIRGYLRGELPEEDRVRFESHFLATAENREQVALMRDLLAAVERVSGNGAPAMAVGPPAQARFRGRVVAAAVVVLTLAGLLAGLAVRRWRPRDERATGGPRSVPSAPTDPRTASPAPRLSPPAAVSVVRLRQASKSPVSAHLSPSTRVLRAEVAVDPEGLSFDATLRAADGTAVWRRGGVAPSAPGQPLVLEVPVEVFASSRYTLRIEGESLRGARPPILEYRLEIVREP